MPDRPLNLIRRLSVVAAVGLAAVFAITLAGQSGPALTVMTREGQRTLPLTVTGNQDFVGLDELAALFQLTVREAAGGVTISYKGRTIVLTGEQPLASIAGRLISLPARPQRSGTSWLVPVEFVSRALAVIYDTPLDLRRPSRLLIVGDLRVPHVTVRHEPLGNAARLTVDATPLATSVVSQEGGRLLIRFEADALDLVPPTIQSQGIVSAVRFVAPVSLAVELGPRFGAFRATSETIETTTRLTIDFTTNATDSTAAPPPPPATPLPNLRQPASLINTIVLDPGHGGQDVGTKGAAGALEKDVTLATARRLKAAIETRLGVRVILTRDEDRLVSIDDRSAIANNNKADLFLSLHANASPRSSVTGAAVFVAAFGDADQSRAVLTPERVPVFGGGMRDIELVPWSFAQLRFLQQSTEVAHILETQLQKVAPLATPAVAGAPFRVLESTNMPALLVEMGYLSNPEQEKQLAGADFQNGLAQAVVEAIIAFRDHLAGTDAER